MKKIIKKILLSINNPLIVFLAMFFYAKKNIYIDKTYLNKSLLFFLYRMRGFCGYFVSSTGSLILIFENKVIKIPLGNVSEKSLEENYLNYLKLKNSIANDLVDYYFLKVENVFFMDRLRKEIISKNELDKIISFIKKSNESSLVINIKYFKFKNIEKIKFLCNIDFCLKEDFYLSTNPMHGDLTSDNIMRNDKNNYVLIDLDRFDFYGFPCIDEIHYFVDSESKKNKISFFNVINNILKNGKFMNAQYVYLYFIYRVCSEYNESIILHESYYSNVKSTLKLFSDIGLVETN